MEYIIGIGVIAILIFIFSGKEKKTKSIEEKPKPKPQFILTDEFKEILNILNNTNESVFITGKAGTGKSSLLKHFIKKTKKKYVVVAPTGIAALNVGGQTIHSFFRFPPAIITPKMIKPDYVRAELFKNLDMMIIDEVSMVRADLMNGIDIALRKCRNKISEPFGGVQMVFIGDLFQLPPVLTTEDRSKILNEFGGQYFFDAKVFRDFHYHFKELTTVFRQSEAQVEFKKMLNNVRNNSVQFEDMVLLNSRHKDNAGVQENSIFLTTKRKIARNINAEKLDKLAGQEFLYLGSLSGKYARLRELGEEKLENKLPAPYRLKLKEGAQIMMLKNDSGKRWVNGSIGKVVKLSEDKIKVSLNGVKHIVEKESWKEVEYVLNKETNEIEEKTIAEFTQYPIRLSYAMTIHKSQGKTFDKITVDVGTGAFAHGQIYVALSRCRTLEGIILNNSIGNHDIIVDPRVVEYYKNRKIIKVKDDIEIQSQPSVKAVLNSAIKESRKVKILYEKFSGEEIERELSNLSISNEFGEFGYENDHIKAYCHLRKEERSFKINRIKKIKLIE